MSKSKYRYVPRGGRDLVLRKELLCHNENSMLGEK